MVVLDKCDTVLTSIVVGLEGGDATVARPRAEPGTESATSQRHRVVVLSTQTTNYNN